MPASLKTRLELFDKEHNWLPERIKLELHAPWGTTENRLQAAIAIIDYSQIPDDSSCGSLTKKEKAFMNEF